MDDYVWVVGVGYNDGGIPTAVFTDRDSAVDYLVKQQRHYEPYGDLKVEADQFGKIEQLYWKNPRTGRWNKTINWMCEMPVRRAVDDRG